MIATRLVTQLKATSGVTDLVSTRIYPGYRPQDDPLPAIVYEATSIQPINHANGTTGTTETKIEVVSYAATYAGAQALGEAVAAALSGWTDSSGCVWLMDSQNDEIGEMQPGAEVPSYFAAVQNYGVWH